jgi:signal transduction histidine kinase/DNA-binding NarL/FixJ family response regulator
MRHLIKILLLEDAPLDAELIKRQLTKGDINHTLLVVRNKVDFKNALNIFEADIVLSDHSIPQFSSNEALQMIQKAGIKVPFILITSTMTDEFAVTIMKEGADDYILKDRLSRLPSAVCSALEKYRLVREQAAERIKINEELKTLNHRLQLATKSANLGIWDWDIHNNTIKWDDGMYELYDFKDQKSEVLYEVWLSKIHSEDRERVAAELSMSRDGIKKYDTEFRILGKHDRIQIIRATGAVELNEIGIPFRMVGINWDITKRKIADQEREVIIKEMSKRNAELEQFSYIISHNLRSPVANIIGAANLLIDADIKGDDRLFLANAVQQSALSLDDIITDLSHVLEIKHDNHTKESVIFTDVVNSIVLSINDLLTLHKFTVSFNFLAVDKIFTVKSYLYSIFYNLISNSIKYRQKHVDGNITIKSELIASCIVLTFSDNGSGINMDKYGDDIFGMYKRFHTDLPGKGMGLFMVKSQVDILGGTVTVDSQENKGTEFRIEFN